MDPQHPPLITVVVADDHAPTRAGIRATLEERGFTVVAEASDGPKAVELAKQHRPDVCLLDVNMPGGDGIPAARAIAASLPDTAVVMLTVSREDDHLFDALRAGACGYLLKDTDPDRLPDALRGVLAGEAALPRALVTRVIEEFQGRGRRRVPLGGRAASLTEREWDVLELMRDGLSTAEIAERLTMAPVTVRTHVAAVLRKLQVPDREAAVRLLNDE